MNTALVVGAGPSGLVAAKELKAQGLTPVVLEQKSIIGGLWKSSSGHTWETLTTNLSKETCKFSDFSWPADTPDFPTQQHMYEYFCRYANHFEVNSCIHLNSHVKSIEKKDGQWQVRWLENGEEKNASFPYVVIASGIFSKAFMPAIQGLETFKGCFIHSKDYKTPSVFAGKKVLVVGNAFSGTDIAAEIATTAQKVVHLFKKPNWIIPRYFPTAESNKKVPLDYAFFKLANLFKPATTALEKFKAINAWYASISQQAKIHKELEITDFEKPPHVAISDTYLPQVSQGNIIPKKGQVASIEDAHVHFDDGKSEEFDEIVFATGYETDLSYLSDEVLNSIEYEPHDRFKPIILDRCTFSKDPSMAFVGMERGPYLGVQEIQARLIARVYAGKISLPSQEELESGYQIEREIRALTPQPQFPQNYMAQAESLAKALGVQPNYELLKKTSPELYRMLMEGFYDPAHFRLFGPDADYASSLNTIQQSNERV